MPTSRSPTIVSHDLVALGLVLPVLMLAGEPGVKAKSTPDWATSPEAYFLTPEERRDW
jgi:hypothetical protein